MAHAAGDSHEIVIYGAHFRVTFPVMDADGDLVSAMTTPDTEVSQDGGTFADATNEATELATASGVYFLDLIGTETDCKQCAVIVKSATAGMKTTTLVLYPERLQILASGTAQAGAASTITLADGTSKVDNDLAGLYVFISNDGAAGSQYQVRKIISNVASTQVATVDSAWGTNPSSASTYNLSSRMSVNVVSFAGTLPPAIHTAGYAVGTIKDGTGTGELDTSSGKVLLADGAHGGTAAVLTLERVVVASTTAGEPAIKATGNTSGAGVEFVGGSSGIGMSLTGNSAVGLNIVGSHGISSSGSSGHGATFVGVGSTRHGINSQGSAASGATPAGHGFNAIGGAASTTGGGTAGVGFRALGGAGAASENGAGVGAAFVGGGTTTVSGALGLSATGTGDLSGASFIGAGAGNGLLLVKGSTGNGLAVDTIAVSSTLTVTGATTFTGAITATNASNNLRLGTFTVDTNAIAWNASWDAEVESEVDDALGGGTGTALTAIPWNASWDAEVQSEVIDALQETVPDTVPADGSRPNVQQAVRMILQALLEGAISGTTWTVNKEDGTTAMLTVTLNSASTPTTKTRAT